jgi:hypothetical protein
MMLFDLSPRCLRYFTQFYSHSLPPSNGAVNLLGLNAVNITRSDFDSFASFMLSGSPPTRSVLADFATQLAV